MQKRQGQARYRDPRPGEVLAFLSRHARNQSCEKDIQIRFDPCPVCKRQERSVTVNAKTGLWKCWRAKCGAKGNWFTLTRAFGEPLPVNDRYVDGPKQVDFSAYEEIRKKMRRPVTAGHYPELLDYCRSRLFTDETLNYWKVSTMGGKALRWPLYAIDEAGKWQVANARLRVVLDRAQADVADWFEIKGGTTDLAIGNHLIDYSGPKRVLITEGQWDAMTAWQVGFRSVLSLPNGAEAVNVNGLLRYVPEDWEIWLAVDMDKGGDKSAELFFAQLGPDRVARLHLPHKDLNDWLKTKPSLSLQDIESCARGFTPMVVVEKAIREKAKFAPLSDLTAGEQVDDQIICETPFPRLTERLGGGWREKWTTGLLAPSGVGKTTLVGQIACDVALAEERTGVIMLEGSREGVVTMLKRQMRGWAETIANGEPIHPSIVPDAMARLMVSELEGKEVRWQDCMEEVEAMADAGAKLIVLDNLDYIMPSTRNASELKIIAYSKFQSLAKKFGFHGIIVWQPNKIDRGKVVNSGDQKGMSQALQDADVYMNLNALGNMRRLEIEKARGGGSDEIQHVWLKYNRATSCLEQREHQTNLTAHTKTGVREI